MGLLSDLIVRIKGDKSGLDSTLKGAESSVNSFGNTVKKLGGILAVAFGVKAIINFAKEASKAASEAEGIERAFAKIGSPVVMGRLMEATRGLFDDDDLAKYAIQAVNLGIPIQDLAKYFEFATKRALTTGKSVDELVNAIVIGVGRKSSRSLIQLGISVESLNKGIKETGSFVGALGKIMDEGLTSMGDVADTTAVKVRQNVVAWGEVKEGIGKVINESKIFATALENISGWLIKIRGLQAGKAGLATEGGIQLVEEMEAEYKGAELVTKMAEKIAEYEARIASIKKNTIEVKSLNTGEVSNYLSKGQIEDIAAYQIKLDILKKTYEGIDPVVLAAAAAAALLAEKQRLSAEAALKEIEAQLALAKARKEAGRPMTAVNTGGLTAKVGATRFDPEVTAITSQFLKGKIKESGGDKLRGGPVTSLTSDELSNITRLNEELKNELTEMKILLTAGRDMALDLGAQLIEGLGEALGGGNVQDIGKTLLLSFANFLGQFGKLLFMAGVGIAAFVESTATLNAPLAIAAGIAMMLAAGAIKGLLKGAAKQSSSSGGSGGYSSQASSGNIKIELTGVLKGSDIWLSGTRYSKQLQTGT